MSIKLDPVVLSAASVPPIYISDREGADAPPAIPRLYSSPGFGPWLAERGGTVVFTTYQSGRVFFLFADAGGQLAARERVFGAAMGIAVDRDKLWLGIRNQVWRFANHGPCIIGETAHDALYIPRIGYCVGPSDTHDLLADVAYGGQRYDVLFANTGFNCIATVDPTFSFVPVWTPDFISDLVAEDRCHLNGIGARDGRLAYATICGRSNEAKGWKAGKTGGGMVVNPCNNDVLCDGLSMPHSPRWYRDRLWLLNSGDGDFGYVDQAGGRFVPVAFCPGFPRGLCFVDDFAIIGLSRFRGKDVASGINLGERLRSRDREDRCGLLVFDIKRGELAHWLSFEDLVTELYDVVFLDGLRSPFSPGFLHPEMHGVYPCLPPRHG